MTASDGLNLIEDTHRAEDGDLLENIRQAPILDSVNGRSGEE